jgi:hypothetical protein
MSFPAYMLYQMLSQEGAKGILEQVAAVLVRAAHALASEDWLRHHCGITKSLLHLRDGYKIPFKLFSAHCS